MGEAGLPWVPTGVFPACMCPDVEHLAWHMAGLGIAHREGRNVKSSKSSRTQKNGTGQMLRKEARRISYSRVYSSLFSILVGLGSSVNAIVGAEIPSIHRRRSILRSVVQAACAACLMPSHPCL